MKFLPSKRHDNWDPLMEMESLQNEIGRLFGYSLTHQPLADTPMFGGQWASAIDVLEAEDHILVKADLPGLKKDEIEISVQENSLVLKGEKKRTEEVKEENFYRSERYHGSFLRVIPLPSLIDSTNIQATYKDGVLEVRMPRKEEAKPKKIKIDVQ